MLQLLLFRDTNYRLIYNVFFFSQSKFCIVIFTRFYFVFLLSDFFFFSQTFDTSLKILWIIYVLIPSCLFTKLLYYRLYKGFKYFRLWLSRCFEFVYVLFLVLLLTQFCAVLVQQILVVMSLITFVGLCFLCNICRLVFFSSKEES